MIASIVTPVPAAGAAADEVDHGFRRYDGRARVAAAAPRRLPVFVDPRPATRD